MIDAKEADFELVKTYGRMAMYTPQQVDPATMPKNIHWYYICANEQGRTVVRTRTPEQETYGILVMGKRPIFWDGKDEISLYGTRAFRRTGLPYRLADYQALEYQNFPGDTTVCMEKEVPAGTILISLKKGNSKKPQILEVVLEYVQDGRLCSKPLFQLEGYKRKATLNGYINDGVCLEPYSNMEM